MKLGPSFWRYTAFQVPGWILAAGGGVMVHRWMDVPIWLASSVLVVWVIKDYALYPILRSAYEHDHRMPIERMIGKLGKASDELSPTGYIRVRGELWRARTSDETSVVKKGESVEVTALDGNLLIVEARDRDG